MLEKIIQERHAFVKGMECIIFVECNFWVASCICNPRVSGSEIIVLLSVARKAVATVNKPIFFYSLRVSVSEIIVLLSAARTAVATVNKRVFSCNFMGHFSELTLNSKSGGCYLIDSNVTRFLFFTRVKD